MKKLVFLAVALFCALATSFSQVNPPSAVTAAFSLKFPDAKNVKWVKENASEFEAGFEWKGLKYSANFNDKGDWLETESPIAFNQLPEKVQKAYNTSHKETVKSIFIIETSKGITTYELEVKKGAKTVEYIYLGDGTEKKE